jgi:hypothetical protein
VCTGAARTLLDGVTLQKFDSLVSLKRPDGITLPSLYNSLRNTFNGYFTEEPAVNSPAESPAGAQAKSTLSHVPAARPVACSLVVVSSINLSIFLCSLPVRNAQHAMSVPLRT